MFFKRFASSAASTSPKLTWNEYFKLKIQRERIGPVFGIPFALGSTAAVITGYEFSPADPILGMDPSIIVMAGAILAGVFGYQSGSFVGQQAFTLAKRRIIKQLDKMDKSFYTRIKTYRADRPQLNYVPGFLRTSSRLSAALSRNPEKKKAAQELANVNAAQDYYGEKIKSVVDYRDWLRRQRLWIRQQFGPNHKPIRGVKE
jgi:mitochondrial import inner membrane translocase subunit TIM23